MIREHVNETFEAYAKHAENNEIEILTSNQCGCFFCRHIYSARTVADWLDENHTVSALCPECGMNTVIGDASHIELTPELLKEMNLYFFDEDEHDTTVAWTYVKRYRTNKITHNPKNEERFVNYLLELYHREHAEASVELGRYYETGGEFGTPNIPLAIATYRAPHLKTIPPALARAGILMLDSKNEDERNEAFSYGAICLSMADAFGAYIIAQCLFRGQGVKFSVEQAYAIVNWNFGVLYESLTTEQGPFIEAFVYYASFLGMMTATGQGTQLDKETAVRYLLFAKLGYQCLLDIGERPLVDMTETDRLLNQLAADINLSKDEMIFDANTFWDSFSLAQNETTVKNLHIDHFDESTGKLYIDITYDEAVPLIDFSNLTFRIIEGTIKWEFSHVASFSGHDGGFTRVGPIDGEDWGFFDGDTPIVRIRYENGQTDKDVD